MFKKIIYVLAYLVFLLSITSVMADDSFETNISSDIDEISIVEEDNLNSDDESNFEEYDEYFEDENEQQTLENIEMNTTDVVMSDDDYSCGAASFTTVLKNLGINMTLDEAKTAVNTTVNGTTMQGLIDGANKYNLTAYGIRADINYLNENYIVHMSINGTDHWSVVKQITDKYITLADPNFGNVNYAKEDFIKLYTNNSVIISKTTNITIELTSIQILNCNETQYINGKASNKLYRTTKYKSFRVIKYKNKNRLQWRWVYKTNIYKSYENHKPYKYYYFDTTYSYTKWYFASKW